MDEGLLNSLREVAKLQARYHSEPYMSAAQCGVASRMLKAVCSIEFAQVVKELESKPIGAVILHQAPDSFHPSDLRRKWWVQIRTIKGHGGYIDSDGQYRCKASWFDGRDEALKAAEKYSSANQGYSIIEDAQPC